MSQSSWHRGLLRRDAQWRLVFDLLRPIVAFHPFAWLLKNQLVLAQEISADREAGRLLSAEGYRKGLCELALRIDAQRQLSRVPFGVSVSANSLVRRIKMLDFPKDRQLNRWQQLLAISMVVISSIGVALCTAFADEPSRTSSPVSRSADASPTFTRFSSQPWEEIGVQNGYFRVLPSVASQRPMIKQPMDEFAAAIGVGKLDCGIELTRDCLSWTSSLDLEIKERDDIVSIGLSAPKVNRQAEMLKKTASQPRRLPSALSIVRAAHDARESVTNRRSS